jgi:hypothetical protein
MKPKLLYTEHPFFALRYFEWAAVERLYATPNGERMRDLYPEQRYLFWMQEFNGLKVEVDRSPRTKNAWVANDIGTIGPDKELDTLEKVYAHIEAQLKLKLRGKALKDAKRAMGQRDYQREALGEGFVDNGKLVSAAKTACKAIAKEGGSSEAVQALIDQEASRLEEMHCEEALNDAQQVTLRDTIMEPIVDALMAMGVVERRLLEGKEKQAYFLWGHIKANCIVGDAIELGQSTYKEWCGGDSKAHKASLDVLAKLGAVRVTWGKKGLATGKATLVKRLL